MSSDRIEGLLAELAIQVPELAPALARLGIEEAPGDTILKRTEGRTNVAFINRDGQGLIATELLESNLFYGKAVLGHEALHMCIDRVASIKDLAGSEWDGDWMRAAKAKDRWINQILVDLDVIDKADFAKLGVLFPNDDQKEWDLMDLWRAERKTPGGGGKGKGKGQKAPQPMAGCSPGDGEGDDPDADGEGEGDADPEREQEAHSIMAGLASMSPALRKLVSPPPPTVRWQDVLHEAAAAARGAGLSARPRITRAKWGRRSTEEIPKPGKASRKPQLVIVVDISGSMTGLLEQVVAESDHIGKHAAVHLILHDSKVLFSGQYRHGRDRINPAGGTDFVPAIEEAARVVKAWPGRSVVVHLTDGYPCGAWPDVPQDFAAGYAGIFGSAEGHEIHGPGRWRSRRCGMRKK